MGIPAPRGRREATLTLHGRAHRHRPLPRRASGPLVTAPRHLFSASKAPDGCTPRSRSSEPVDAGRCTTGRDTRLVELCGASKTESSDSLAMRCLIGASLAVRMPECKRSGSGGPRRSLLPAIRRVAHARRQDNVTRARDAKARSPAGRRGPERGVEPRAAERLRQRAMACSSVLARRAGMSLAGLRALLLRRRQCFARWALSRHLASIVLLPALVAACRVACKLCCACLSLPHSIYAQHRSCSNTKISLSLYI